MGCIFGCLSERDKINRVLKKFKDHNISALDRIEPSDSPQSMSGKIAKKDKSLIAPVSEKECVYFHTVCEQEVQKTRPVTRDGRQEIQTYYEWVHKFTHTESVDFYLVDGNNPKVRIVVPVEASSLKSHSSVDAFKKNYSQGSNYPLQLTRVTGRYGVRNTGHVRFKESSFDIDEAVCVLGIVGEMNLRDEIIKVVNPVSKDSLSEAYFEKNEWTDWDKKSWADLTEKPCIIVSDAPKHQ